MIDFACKRFNLEDIIKCGLGLTKSEFEIFKLFLDNLQKEFNTNEISDCLGLNLSTVQKGVKKLYSIRVIKRNQKNLISGGYVFVYLSKSRNEIKTIIKEIISNWSKKVNEEIDNWNI